MYPPVAPFIVSLGVALLAAACSAPSTPPGADRRPAAATVSQPGLATVTGRAPRGTVIALEPAPGVAPPPPQGSLLMDQRGQQFIPDLLVAREGQPVDFRNGEGISHNVYVTRGTAVEFNVSTDPFQAYTHTFTQSGVYNVSCDIHPSMRALLVVVGTPYTAIADDFGNYQILNVPPGRYTLVSMAGDQRTERAVEVSGEHTAVGSQDR